MPAAAQHQQLLGHAHLVEAVGMGVREDVQVGVLAEVGGQADDLGPRLGQRRKRMAERGGLGALARAGERGDQGLRRRQEPGRHRLVVAVERAPSDHGTLWAGLRRGPRVRHVQCGQRGAGSVVFYRIDTAATPTRFVSGIAVDPGNPNHAYVSFSGYNAYATASSTATGHVFEVTYNPTTHTATWNNRDYNLGDQPITDIAFDWNTGDLFVSTDFGVNLLRSGDTQWVPAAGSLPPVAVYGLTINSTARVLYAATHGRGAWKLDLR